MLWHLPDHTTVPQTEFDAKLEQLLLKPEWILDGNYLRTALLRMLYADTLFWFDLPAEICLQGIYARLGTKRPDMPWEPETAIDPAFEQYVRTFPEQKAPYLEQMMAAARALEIDAHIFHTHRQANRFLESLDAEQPDPGA